MRRSGKRRLEASPENPPRKKTTKSKTVAAAEPATRSTRSGPFENASETIFSEYDVGKSTLSSLAKKFMWGMERVVEIWLFSLMQKCKAMTVLCILVKRGKLDVLSRTEDEDFWIWHDICKLPDPNLDYSNASDVIYDPVLEELNSLDVHTIWARFAAVAMHQIDNEPGPSWPEDSKAKLGLPDSFVLKLRPVNTVSGMFYKYISENTALGAEKSDEIADDYMREKGWDAEATLEKDDSQKEGRPEPALNGDMDVE